MSDRFNPAAISGYLQAVLRKPIDAVRVTPLGGGRQGDKGYGYGIPLRVDYEAGGTPRRAVIESVRPGPFGHDHMADRAQQLLWAHDAFGRLPRHVRSLDVGAVRASGELVPLGNAEELFMLAEFVDGREYADDLIRLRAGGPLLALDRERADALADYLVEIHRTRGGDAGLYLRRVRELVGHGECIFGVCDSYPSDGPVRLERLREMKSAASTGAGSCARRRPACDRCTATSIRGTSSSATAPTSACSTVRAANGASRPTMSPAWR